MVCDCSFCIFNSVFVFLINVWVSSWEKKILRKGYFGFKLNRNRLFCIYY